MTVETAITQIAIPLLIGSGIISTAVHFLRKPKLDLGDPLLISTKPMILTPLLANVKPQTNAELDTLEVSIFLVCIPIKRKGKHFKRLKRAATNVEVYVESVQQEENGINAELKSFSHQILCWYKTGGSATACSRIGTEPRYCCLCQCTKQDSFGTKDPKVICQISNQDDSLLPGSYRIGLSISADNANKITPQLRLHFSGEWSNDEREMSDKGLRVFLVTP